jgi:flavin-dependent dehydrogenase
VVASLDYLFRSRLDHETIYQNELERCPAVRKLVACGRRAKRYYSSKDSSYRSSQAAGDGWVLIGDAFGCLDPLYGSRVFLALKSGERAADAVAEGFARGDLSGAQLGKWGPEFIRGMNRLKRLVYFFDQGFRFDQFLSEQPEYRRHLIDLLAGDLFKESLDEVFGPLQDWQRDREPMPCHV